jgi:hypothetical protein
MVAVPSYTDEVIDGSHVRTRTRGVTLATDTSGAVQWNRFVALLREVNAAASFNNLMFIMPQCWHI